MTTHPFNHIGILVADLAEASARFSAALGLTFTEPIVPTGGQLADQSGERQDRTGMAFCYYYEAVCEGHVPDAHALKKFYHEQYAAAEKGWGSAKVSGGPAAASP